MAKRCPEGAKEVRSCTILPSSKSSSRARIAEKSWLFSAPNRNGALGTPSLCADTGTSSPSTAAPTKRSSPPPNSSPLACRPPNWGYPSSSAAHAKALVSFGAGQRGGVGRAEEVREPGCGPHGRLRRVGNRSGDEGDDHAGPPSGPRDSGPPRLPRDHDVGSGAPARVFGGGLSRLRSCRVELLSFSPSRARRRQPR